MGSGLWIDACPSIYELYTCQLWDQAFSSEGLTQRGKLIRKIVVFWTFESLR